MGNDPELSDLVLEMRDVLEPQGYLSGAELAAALEPRLTRLAASLVPAPPTILRKLVALREWLTILRDPVMLEEHGGTAYVGSFLAADCLVLGCLLAGPPDPEPGADAAEGW